MMANGFMHGDDADIYAVLDSAFQSNDVSIGRGWQTNRGPSISLILILILLIVISILLTKPRARLRLITIKLKEDRFHQSPLEMQLRELAARDVTLPVATQGVTLGPRLCEAQRLRWSEG